MCFTARYHGPYGLLVAKISRDGHGKHAPVSAGEKVRRLSLVDVAGLYEVVRADRDVEHFLPVAVEVTERQRKCAVLVLKPALEHRRHRRAAFPSRGERKLAGANGREAGDEGPRLRRRQRIPDNFSSTSTRQQWTSQTNAAAHPSGTFSRNSIRLIDPTPRLVQRFIVARLLRPLATEARRVAGVATAVVHGDLRKGAQRSGHGYLAFLVDLLRPTADRGPWPSSTQPPIAER